MEIAVKIGAGDDVQIVDYERYALWKPFGADTAGEYFR